MTDDDSWGAAQYFASKNRLTLSAQLSNKVEIGEECLSPNQLMSLGSVVSLSSGDWGRAPVENEFGAFSASQSTTGGAMTALPEVLKVAQLRNAIRFQHSPQRMQTPQSLSCTGMKEKDAK